MSSYLDWVKDGKVELHVSSIRSELGLGGRNQSVGEIYWGVCCVISQNHVGDSIHTDLDACVEALKNSVSWGVTPNEGKVICVETGILARVWLMGRGGWP